jgi:hypothetical protein
MGKWQKLKELGSTPWNPPASETSELWDKPNGYKYSKEYSSNNKHVISKSLLKNIVGG